MVYVITQEIHEYPSLASADLYMENSSNAAIFYNSSHGTGVEEGFEQMKLTETIEKKLVLLIPCKTQLHSLICILYVHTQLANYVLYVCMYVAQKFAYNKLMIYNLITRVRVFAIIHNYVASYNVKILSTNQLKIVQYIAILAKADCY